LAADAEQPLELGRVVPDLAVATRDRREQRDHRLADRLLERAVALAVEARLDLLGRLAAGDGEDVDQVGDSLLALTATHLAAGVGDCRLELPPDRIRLVEDSHRSLVGAA